MSAYKDGCRQLGIPCTEVKCPYGGLEKLAWWARPQGGAEGQRGRRAIRGAAVEETGETDVGRFARDRRLRVRHLDVGGAATRARRLDAIERRPSRPSFLFQGMGYEGRGSEKRLTSGERSRTV